jgi:hypothetical protein
MKKIFIYVGHSNWGKSRALKVITSGSSRRKTTQIDNQWIWVRKMSNDDKPIALLKFVRSSRRNPYQNFILAYCPKHETDSIAMQILKALSQNDNRLYFFVQECKYNDPNQIITTSEMEYLRRIGTVEILCGQNSDAARASWFKQFIQANMGR